MNEIIKNADSNYKEFHKKLLPNIGEDSILGLRSPLAESIAKKYANTKEGEDFLNSLPHNYYDENVVHAFILGKLNCNNENDNKVLQKRIEEFLPYVDNWAVCDGLCSHLKKFFQNPRSVYDFVIECTKSHRVYTVRFGLVSLLNYYIDEQHIYDILKICQSIRSEEYYVNMAISWLISFCLIKEYEKTLPIIEKNCLSKWVHNKSIQKAIESYRIDKDKKDYLRSLKIK